MNSRQNQGSDSPKNRRPDSASDPEQPYEDMSNVEHLLKKVRGGDETALGELTEACRDYLLLIANQELDRDLNQKLGPSDVVQNTMLAIHENVNQFQGDRAEQFVAWIRQILLNDLNRVRRQFKGTEKRNAKRERPIKSNQSTAQESIQIADQNWTPQTNAVNQERTRLVERAMESLSGDYRQIIHLRNAEQMSFAEIGTRLGKSEDAAQKLWTRAILKLKAELKSLDAI